MLWGHSVPTLSLQEPTSCPQLCTGVSWTQQCRASSLGCNGGVSSAMGSPHLCHDGFIQSQRDTAPQVHAPLSSKLLQLNHILLNFTTF